VHAITDMLRTVLGASIQLQIDIRDTSPVVEADAAQFDTALVNMAVNARDAMVGEGRLSLTVEATPATGPRQGSSASRSPTRQRHRARGCATHLRALLHHQGVGQGTGLGLSQVYGFAKQSGGEVGVHTELGSGTTFTLSLPRSNAPLPAPPERAPGERARHRGRVLIVEDNEQVREFACHLLEDLGYQTSEAADADQALALLERAEPPVDLMFSDVMMPGMGGSNSAPWFESGGPRSGSC
jgi:hypothetical protein